MANSTTVNPDVRFGTSYLSIKYEDAAVASEVLMDKMDGEIFIKRPLDNKVISFSQNNKFLHETLLELKILLKNYSNIKYPLSDASYFTSTDYILRYLSSGDTKEILAGDDLTFNTTSLDTSKKFEFYVSKESNGFFCMIKPRLSDKTFIEYLDNEYNLLCKDYSGTDASIIAEREKFNKTGYETSNASVKYTITITGLDSSGNEKIAELDSTCYVHMGEESVVPFPTNYNSNFAEITKIKVNINSITFDKIRFIDNYIHKTEDFDKTVYNNLIAPDNRIEITNINIFSFIDNASQIPSESSRQNIVVINSVALHDYLGILDKLSVGSGFIVSDQRPIDSVWTNNNAWAETIRNVKYGGVSYKTDCETDINVLESLIYDMDGIVTGFSLDETEQDMLYIQRLAKGSGV